jgi:monolysocardiolipin acyltransferase
MGQTLPTHRLAHSSHGGLFQPTMTQAIRLLSAPPTSPSPFPSSSLQDHGSPGDDPFVSNQLTYPATYTTTGTDSWPAPWGSHAWLHVFPEGAVHQTPGRSLRYFKWGVARLILEADPAPELVPLFVEGTDGVMPAERGFPKFVPRIGNRIRVAFGEVVDCDDEFGDLRARWRRLVERQRAGQTHGGVVGELVSDELRDGVEARDIRIEAARRVRERVLDVRRGLGYPEESPELGRAETWAKDAGRKGEYRSDVDGSNISQE